jgi:hypothetical protein
VGWGGGGGKQPGEGQRGRGGGRKHGIGSWGLLHSGRCDHAWARTPMESKATGTRPTHMAAATPGLHPTHSPSGCRAAPSENAANSASTGAGTTSTWRGGPQAHAHATHKHQQSALRWVPVCKDGTGGQPMHATGPCTTGVHVAGSPGMKRSSVAASTWTSAADADPTPAPAPAPWGTSASPFPSPSSPLPSLSSSPSPP